MAEPVPSMEPVSAAMSVQGPKQSDQVCMPVLSSVHAGILVKLDEEEES